MPRMDAAIYAAHMDNVLKLAKAQGGVSRPQIISELNVTRTIANGLIEKCDLVKLDRPGRTEYFATNGVAAVPEVKQSNPKTVVHQLPEAVQAVATPTSDDTGEPSQDDAIAALDAQILDTRASIRAAAEKAGKALGEWALQDGIVDAMRARISEQIQERLRLDS